MRFLVFLLLAGCVDGTSTRDVVVLFGGDDAAREQFSELADDRNMRFVAVDSAAPPPGIVSLGGERVLAIGIGSGTPSAEAWACTFDADALVLIDATSEPLECDGRPTPYLRYASAGADGGRWLDRNQAKERFATVDDGELQCRLWWGAAPTGVCVRPPGDVPLRRVGSRSALNDPASSALKWALGGWNEQLTMLHEGHNH